jgi:hypothetical protein
MRSKPDLLALWDLKRPVRLILRNGDSLVIGERDDAKLLDDRTLSVWREEGYWTLVHRDAVVSLESAAP